MINPSQRTKASRILLGAAALSLAMMAGNGCSSSGGKPAGAVDDCCADGACAVVSNPASKPVATQAAPKAPATGEMPGKTGESAPPAAAPQSGAPAAPAAVAAKDWEVIFDGKEMGQWKPTMFGGNDDATIENGEMIIPEGSTLSGANYFGSIPGMNYEVELEARRRNGTDFFVGLTVPVERSDVDKAFVSLILGGWGGQLCGISSIDSSDASENSTTTFQTFEKNKWYKVRFRVLPTRLQAWLDDKQIIDADTTNKRLGIRVEVSKSKPFGIAAWQTESGVRSVKVRKLGDAEVKDALAAPLMEK